MKKFKIVVLSGAGISAESGIATFRSGETALWNNHKIADVCTAEAWQKNPTKVNDFYNERRIEVLNASPNSAHIKLAEMEKYFNIQIITSNVDDLKYIYILIIAAFKCLKQNYTTHTKRLI